MVYLPQPDVDLTLASHSPVDWDIPPMGGDMATASPEQVLLVPGKLTEVAVRIKNNSQQGLQVSLGLQGGFPDGWFTPVPPQPEAAPETRTDIRTDIQTETWLGNWTKNVQVSHQQSLQFGTDYFDLPPRQTTYINLGFTLPDHYFEDPHALRSQKHLNQGFGGEIFLHQVTDSTPTSTPQLIAYKTLQLYTRPARIYQKFLPEFYQESDFLGRFLNICEQSFEPVYETAETFWSYLDPLLTPKALVPFLAHWVAWPMNPSLTLSQQRRLIRHAVEIYQWRGSARGVKLVLHLCTGLDPEQIEVLEPDEVEFAVGDITLGDQPCLGGGKAYHFAVILKPITQDQLNTLDEASIRTLIEQEKPAFCTYDLEIVHPATIPPSPQAPFSPVSPTPDPQPAISDGVL